MDKIRYSKGLKYKRLKGGGCALVGRGRCRDEEIVVPSKVFLYGEVISIFDKAFSGDERLQKVVLPDTVKEINESAFYNCKNLRKVRLPNGLEKLGEYAFCGCAKLRTVTLPPSLKKVSGEAFALCDQLWDINLKNVESIGVEAFYCCEKLMIADLQNLQWLSKKAFKGCTELDCVFISEKLQGIGDAVFAGAGYHLNKKNWTKEGILYLDGWVLTTTGENRPYKLDKNTKGIGREAFYEVYEKKKTANPTSYTEEDEWYVRFYGESPETRKKYTIDLIYPGTMEEWSKVKKSESNTKYFYKIQTTDGILEEEF